MFSCARADGFGLNIGNGSEVEPAGGIREAESWDQVQFTRKPGTSVVAWWIRLHLPMEGTQSSIPGLGNSTCRGTLSPCGMTTEPVLLKPTNMQLQACMLQLQSLRV